MAKSWFRSVPATTAPPGTTSANCAPASPANFPTLTFFFQPADIVGQILNFGLPAPIDIQVVGPLHQRQGELRARQADRAAPRADSRRRRRAYPPGGGRPRAALQCGPHARRAAGPHPEGRGQQPADVAQLQHCRSRPTTGSIRRTASTTRSSVQTPAVSRRFHLRAARAPRFMPACGRAPQLLTNVGHAGARHHRVGGQPLQRAAALRCLRQRAGPRSGRGGRAMSTRCWTSSSPSCPRAASSKPAARWPDHEGLRSSGWASGWSSRSCWCIS